MRSLFLFIVLVMVYNIGNKIIEEENVENLTPVAAYHYIYLEFPLFRFYRCINTTAIAFWGNRLILL